DAEPPVVGEVAAGLQGVDLANEHVRVDDHARPHHAHLARVEDAGGHEVQDRLLALHHQRVPGVVAAVVAHDHVGVGGEEIDDLPLSLVTPLGADDGSRRHWHQSLSNVAETTWGCVRSAASTVSGTGSSTWKSEMAMPPTCSRPSSRPAMLILFSPSSVPTRPTTPGTSRLRSMRT